VDTLLKFNRLQKLSEDANVITGAISKSGSEILELNDDKSKVRRSADKPVADLTDEQRKELNLRTVHFKGFPLDSDLDDIKAFAEQYGKIESVEMRRQRNDDRKFKVRNMLGSNCYLIILIFLGLLYGHLYDIGGS